MGKYVQPINKPKKPEKFIKVYQQKSVKTLQQAVDLVKKLGKKLSEVSIVARKVYSYYKPTTVYVRWYDEVPNPKYQEQLKKYNEQLKAYVKELDKKLDKSAKAYEKCVKEHNAAIEYLSIKIDPVEVEKK